MAGDRRAAVWYDGRGYQKEPEDDHDLPVLRDLLSDMHMDVYATPRRGAPPAL